MKNPITNNLIFIALLFAFSIKAHSQSVTDAFSHMDSIGPNLFAGSFTILLDDTTDVSALEVKLGTFENGTDLMDYTYTYDVTTGLPSGWTYSRNKNTINLFIGTYTEKFIYYGQVRVMDTNNSWSSAFKFVSN